MKVTAILSEIVAKMSEINIAGRVEKILLAKTKSGIVRSSAVFKLSISVGAYRAVKF